MRLKNCINLAVVFELFMRVMQAANIGQGSAYFGQIVPLFGKIGKGYELGKNVG